MKSHFLPMLWLEWVAKYSINSVKFLSLSIIVDGAILCCLNMCMYSTSVDVFIIISACVACHVCGTLLKNLMTSVAILLAASSLLPSAAVKYCPKSSLLKISVVRDSWWMHW